MHVGAEEKLEDGLSPRWEVEDSNPRGVRGPQEGDGDGVLKGASVELGTEAADSTYPESNGTSSHECNRCPDVAKPDLTPPCEGNANVEIAGGLEDRKLTGVAWGSTVVERADA